MANTPSHNAALRTSAAAAVVEVLQPQFRGILIRPQDQDYDAARAVWNGAVDRRPALIARCTSTDDVVAAVRAARAQDLEIAIRGGGHNIAGLAVVDGAVTIDLSPMRAVRVDPQRRRAFVEAGCLLSDLDQESQRYGLAVTSGLVSHTGIAGLTLGGGVGWLARKYGLACDNLMSAQVVTADGNVIVAGEETDADLLWALRGGGGNFGIVTSFEYRLHQVGPIVVSGTGFYAIEDAPTVMDAFRSLAASASDETTWVASVWNAEADTPIPAEHIGKPILTLVFAHVGPVEEGLAVGGTLRTVAQPLAEIVGPLPYTELQACNDDNWKHGVRRYWKSHYIRQLPDPALQAFLNRGSLPEPAAGFVAGSLQALGGAISNIADDATAVGHRDAMFDFMATTAWSDPGEDDNRQASVRQYADAVQPFSRGVYVNNLGIEGDARVRSAFGQDKYERLASLKARYDPHNIFHLNQNILPAHTANLNPSPEPPLYPARRR